MTTLIFVLILFSASYLYFRIPFLGYRLLISSMLLLLPITFGMVTATLFLSKQQTAVFSVNSTDGMVKVMSGNKQQVYLPVDEIDYVQRSTGGFLLVVTQSGNYWLLENDSDLERLIISAEPKDLTVDCMKRPLIEGCFNYAENPKRSYFGSSTTEVQFVSWTSARHSIMEENWSVHYGSPTHNWIDGQLYTIYMAAEGCVMISGTDGSSYTVPGIYVDAIGYHYQLYLPSNWRNKFEDSNC